MTPRSRYLILGAATLVIGLLAMFPARVAYRWIAPPDIALSGIEGTIWNGRASSGSAAGLYGLYLSNIEFQISPLSIFSGKIGFHASADTASGSFEANVAVGAGGSASLANLNAELSLQELQSLVGMPGLGGVLKLEFDRLDIENGIPVDAVGSVEVSNLRAPIIHRSPIGDFRARFDTQESGVRATVESTDAVIALEGSVTLSADMTYQFIAQVSPTTRTPTDLREQMRFLGSADESGQYQLRLEGQL